MLRSLIGRDFFVDPDYNCVNEHFGSRYGGWDVVVTSLSKNSVVYSFGIGEDASFDIALIERFGMDVYAFDPTPRSIAWVSSQVLPSQFILFEYGIADFDGNIYFNPPEDPAHVSYTILTRPKTESKRISAPVKRLTTIMKELKHTEIDLLKMDIEGAEYRVVDDIDTSGIRPKQLLVEFHHRFQGVGVQKSRNAIAKLKAMGYGLFSVSDTGEEYSFLYRDA